VINYAPKDAIATCDQSSDQVRVDCGIDRDSGYPITLTTRTATSGRIEYVAHGIRDGTDIFVTATNVASRNPLGRPTTRKVPPLDLGVLTKLASNSELRYR
jgi:hypothetical protein